MGQFGKYERAEDIPEEERKFYFMGDKFRPVGSIEWVDILFNQRWPVRIPKFLHDYHDWWDYWEIDCHLSMEKLLKPGMLLYDVGAFDGWQSAVFSQMVGGPKNIVLVEPVTEMWANTKATWEQNKLEAPRASLVGFAGDCERNFPTIYENCWPVEPDYSQMLKAIKFKLLHEHAEHTPCMKLDTMGKFTGMPDALHIDVEGAGLIVLRGAEQILATKKPLVWIAIHPPFMRERFNTEPEELHEFMRKLGYCGTHLATDHEEHWLFQRGN